MILTVPPWLHALAWMLIALPALAASQNSASPEHSRSVEYPASDVIQVAGSQLIFHYLHPFTEAEQVKLVRWLSAVAHSASLSYGRLPRSSIQIELIPQRQSRQAVPYGNIIRGAQQGIRFYVNPQQPLSQFIDDWTAYHEFSHLMIPYPGDDDLWFSEGLASYYQNILMARAGILTPLQAWQKIYAGFQRGANDQKMAHLKLAQLSPRMRSSGSFMRVYWSGAAYFLRVDIALRQRGQSLDGVLSRLQQCCLQQDRRWSAKMLADKMDQLSASSIFSQQYQHSIASTSLSGFEQDLTGIGLSIDRRQLRVADPQGLHHLIMNTP